MFRCAEQLRKIHIRDYYFWILIRAAALFCVRVPRGHLRFSANSKKKQANFLFFLVFCFWHREENQKTSFFLCFLYWREIKHEKQKLTKNRPKKSNLWLFVWFISMTKNKRFLLIFVIPPAKKIKRTQNPSWFLFFIQHINQKTKIFSWFLFFLQQQKSKNKVWIFF